MAVKPAELDAELPRVKRQKLSRDVPTAVESEVNIKSTEDLKKSLAFEQDAGPNAMKRVKELKSFLTQLQYGKEPETKIVNQSILLEVFKSKSPSAVERSRTAFTDLIQSWHFAVQAGVESLCSAISAVFALLLKSISRIPDFRDYGVALCRELLHEDHMNLFDRSLTAHRSKKHLIGPCIRLLTEVVQFDGGSCAKIIYRQRATTFQRLEVFLSMHKEANEQDDDSSKRRPSIREIALEYLIANVKFQTDKAKGFLLKHNLIVRAWLRDVPVDPAWAVRKTLQTLTKDVAEDASLDYHTKIYLFDSSALTDLSKLYNYKGSADVTIQSQMRELIQDFLLVLLNSRTHGLLQPSLDPVRHHRRLDDVKTSKKDKESKKHDAKDDFKARRNVIRFLQYLRPHADLFHSDLIVKAFDTDPTLSKDYFSAETTFSFDPKLTATWVGYSRFLLAVIQLPIPTSLIGDGALDDEGLSVVVNCLLPQPLQAKTLTRCLNQHSRLVTFFTINILIAAFKKLDSVTRKLAKAHNNFFSHNYEEDLKARFAARCPDMRHVIAQFHSCPKDKQSFRENITNLLSLYCRLIPEVALEEKIDVSVVLSERLTAAQESSDQELSVGLDARELEHLLEVAIRSPGMKWWHKPGMNRQYLIKIFSFFANILEGNDKSSPFIALLRLCARHPRDQRHTEQILNVISQDSGLFRPSPEAKGLSILLATLRSLDGELETDVYSFLDNTISRLPQRAVAYHYLLKDITRETLNIDLLLIAVSEQWQYQAQMNFSTFVSNITIWLVSYLCLAAHSISNGNLVSILSAKLQELDSNEETKKLFEELITQHCNTESHDTLRAPVKPVQQMELVLPGGQTSDVTVVAQVGASVLAGPALERLDHPEMHRWKREKVQDAVSEHMIGELVLCLCSQHKAVRLESGQALQSFVHALTISTYPERHQTELLIRELIETTRKIGHANPLPYFVGALTAGLLQVLDDPLHFMYSKANKFLHRSPSWIVQKLPSYWIDKVILHGPSDTEMQHCEVQWLLNILLDGLRTSDDMELYRQCHVFEHLLSIAVSPVVPDICYDKIVELLFRCTYVNGSTTLITRYGLLSWIASCVEQKSADSRERLLSLAARMYDTADHDRLNDWSDDSHAATLRQLNLSKGPCIIL
ncbi:uncharacterized protein KY384_007634 [Bacidia gigantensis]|uniref:uncharacterized protein n=1 Tax=Bacidia gigantensis TaxID=2732470 RepID=UPI001D058508|nr:uncharacterized protein KY384_007634 [Bacidia gigantensis]KAG8527482.1 hypothetical protein KY384_007634 [Bacidia gigantensis]